MIKKIFQNIISYKKYLIALLESIPYLGSFLSSLRSQDDKNETDKLIEKEQFVQKKLDKELENGRIKSALKILEKHPHLNFNISQALDIVLQNKEDPVVF